jgi:hypothetical protein
MDLTGIGAVFDLGSKIIDRVWPDPAQRDAAKLELFKAQQAGEFQAAEQAFELAKGQQDINKVEAGNASVFISGWRPFIGWVCGASLAYAGLIDPLARFLAQVVYRYAGPFPAIDTTVTLQVLLGLLGLGSLRTYEKLQGVAGK